MHGSVVGIEAIVMDSHLNVHTEGCSVHAAMHLEWRRSSVMLNNDIHMGRLREAMHRKTSMMLNNGSVSSNEWIVDNDSLSVMVVALSAD